MMKIIIVCLFSVLPVLPASSADYARVEVRVEGIRNQQGLLGVALFSGVKGYPVHIEHAYEVEWIELKGKGSAVAAVFDGIPAGEYAVSVVHDENATKKLERTGFGFPKEGVGFSNGQKVKMSAPKFEKSKFSVANGEHKKMVIQLDYRRN